MRNLSTGDADVVADSFNSFAFDLYKQLGGTEKNTLFSPFSIAIALTMVEIGARKTTTEEIRHVLHLSLQESPLKIAVSSIMEKMHASDPQKKNQLHIANALWLKKGYSVIQDYRKSIQESFSGNLFEVNFHAVDVVRQQINTWVSKQTQRKIPQLIEPGAIDPASVLVLTNAIYFFGQWLRTFSESKTQDRPFHLSNGQEKKVPTMCVKDLFGYTEDGNIQFLELPYVGETLAMGIILPKELNGLPDVEGTFSLQQFTKLTNACPRREVMVFLPRFKLESTFDLAPTLQQMGIKTAFNALHADFSGITNDPIGTFISAVIHKAFMDVTEKGTEAAAATAISMPMACPQSVKEELIPTFRADHPFIVFIRHTHSNAILFLGKVLFPSSTK